MALPRSPYLDVLGLRQTGPINDALPVAAALQAAADNGDALPADAGDDGFPANADDEEPAPEQEQEPPENEAPAEQDAGEIESDYDHRKHL